MSNLTDFFPSGGGGNPSLLTDINLLPKIIARGATIKTDRSTMGYSWQNQTAFYDTAFFTSNIGSRVQISGTGYNTICDLTGSGEFYSALGSIADQFNGRTISWKFTIDGVETIINVAINVNMQMYIGHYIPTIVTRVTTDTNPAYGGPEDYGSFGGYNTVSPNKFLTIQGQGIGMYRQDAFKNLNLPRLKFESSFKLEYSTDDGTTGAYNRYVVAQYQLN
jgi:hypothetical protein